MTFQAVAKMSNDRSLVIGEIITKEAESASGEDSGFDGLGLYLGSSLKGVGKSELGAGLAAAAGGSRLA
jgi:hypothetical protein